MSLCKQFNCHPDTLFTLCSQGKFKSKHFVNYANNFTALMYVVISFILYYLYDP